MASIQLQGEDRLLLENIALREEILKRDINETSRLKGEILGQILSKYNIDTDKYECSIENYVLNVKEKNVDSNPEAQVQKEEQEDIAQKISQLQKIASQQHFNNP